MQKHLKLFAILHTKEGDEHSKFLDGKLKHCF